MDTAEHMFTKCKQLTSALTPSTAETLADLLYEVGKDHLSKRNYEMAIRWLERAYEALEEQDLELLSPAAGELRLSTMHNTGMCSFIWLETSTADGVYSTGPSEDEHSRIAGQSMEYGEAHGNSELRRQESVGGVVLMDDRITLTRWWCRCSKLSCYRLQRHSIVANSTKVSRAHPVPLQYLTRSVLLRMIRTIVLNDTNFKTIIHHVHRLKEHRYAKTLRHRYHAHRHSNVKAGKILDNLIDIRLFREENRAWVEKAVVTRIWITTTNMTADDNLEQLQELLDLVSQNSKDPLSAPATHAAQTVSGLRTILCGC